VATEEVALERLSPETVISQAVPVATLDLDARDLARRAGLEWTAIEDELGPAIVAVVRAEHDDPAFALLSYDAVDGVTVLGDPASAGHHLDRLLSRLMVHDDELEGRVGDPAAAMSEEQRLMLALDEVTQNVDALKKQLAALLASRLSDEARMSASTGLTQAQQDVLALSVVGHSYHEIAEMLGVSESAVRQRLARARRVVEPGE
jgi:DNA-directed RNA polymerase specialized sigma24 family protein